MKISKLCAVRFAGLSLLLSATGMALPVASEGGALTATGVNALNMPPTSGVDSGLSSEAEYGNDKSRLSKREPKEHVYGNIYHHFSKAHAYKKFEALSEDMILPNGTHVRWPDKKCELWHLPKHLQKLFKDKVSLTLWSTLALNAQVTSLPLIDKHC